MIDLDAEQRAIKVEDARAAVLVSRGMATVFLPSLIPLALGSGLALYLADHTGWWSLVILFGSILVMWAVHTFLVRRWWTWATSQDVDLSIRRDAAEDAKLIWPRNTFFGRREAPTLHKLTSRNRLSPDP